MSKRNQFAGIVIALAMSIIPCHSWGESITPKGAKGTIQEQNKKLIERLFYEGFSGGDLSVVESIFSPEIAFFDANLPSGIEGIKAIVSKNNSTFENWHFTLHDVLAIEDKVVVRWTGTGVHANSFMAEPPTGKQVSLNGIAIYQIKDGRIAVDWVIPDNLQFLMQLGVLKPFKMAESK